MVRDGDGSFQSFDINFPPENGLSTIGQMPEIKILVDPPRRLETLPQDWSARVS